MTRSCTPTARSAARQHAAAHRAVPVRGAPARPAQRRPAPRRRATATAAATSRTTTRTARPAARRPAGNRARTATRAPSSPLVHRVRGGARRPPTVARRGRRRTRRRRGRWRRRRRRVGGVLDAVSPRGHRAVPEEEAQVAVVDVVHAEQHHEVGAAEVGVVGRRAAHPRAEAQVAAQQRGIGARCDRDDPVRVPRVQRLDARTAAGARWRARTRSRTLAASPPPSASGTLAQPREPAVAGEQHVAGDAGPDEPDDGAVAVVGVHAGAPGLHERRPQRRQRVDVELALGVEAAGGGARSGGSIR